MNKLIRRLAMAFVGISMAVGVGVAVGARADARMVSAADTTFTGSDFTAVSESDYSKTKGSVTIAVTASTVTADQIRIFKNQTITISSTNSITNIVFTCTANGTAKYGPGCFEAITGYSFEAEGKTGTWTGKTSSITFTASTNQVRCTSIVVTEGAAFGTLDHIKISTPASKLAYIVGETFSSSGLVLTGYDGANEATANSQTYYSGYTTNFDDHEFVVGDLGNKTVTVTYSGKTTTYGITVSNPDTYTLVTDLTQLTEGNKIIFVAYKTDTTTYYACNSYTTGNNITSTSITVTNDTISYNGGDISPYTLGINSQGYTFKDKNNNYLYAPGTKTTGENYLKAGELGNNSYFKIGLESGNYSVVSTNNTKAGVMQFNAASNQLKFACYNTASQTAIKIFVLNTNPNNSDKVTSFGKLYLKFAEHAHNPEDSDTGACKGASGPYYTAKNALLGDWSSILSYFRDNSSNERARYQAWASAVGDASPYALPAGSANYEMNNVNNSSTTTLVIIVISAISLIAVSSYFVIRRRKENN